MSDELLSIPPTSIGLNMKPALRLLPALGRRAILSTPRLTPRYTLIPLQNPAQHRSFTSTSSRPDGYRPPAFPDAELPLGYVEPPRSERMASAKSGFRLFVKYCAYGFTILGVFTMSFFEGMHYYVEWYKLPQSSSDTDDEYGWEDEMISWTGGSKGGSSPRLGVSGRHAVRAAWMAQEWGFEGGRQESVADQAFFEPDSMLLKRLKRSEQRPRERGFQVDKGYLYADQYIEQALNVARNKGMEFPPELSITRPPGPSPALSAPQRSPSSTVLSSESHADPLVVDLLLLRANNYEKISRPAALVSAKEIYERALNTMSSDGSPRQNADVMRLAKKVGDLCERIGAGDEALLWYDWGLHRIGVDLQQLSTKRSSWLGDDTSTLSASSLTSSPVLLRATLSLLSAASTHYATHSRLDEAWNVQNTSLSLFPDRQPLLPLSPSEENASAALHSTWLRNRHTMFNLHQASVAHALKKNKEAMDLADRASTRADRDLTLIDPIPSVYASSTISSLYQPSQQLHRDALLLAAEASFIRGRFLEQQKRPDLALIAGCFERAADLSGQESGKTEETAMGKDWHRYWRNYVRIKEQLGEVVPSPFDREEAVVEGMEAQIVREIQKALKSLGTIFGGESK